MPSICCGSMERTCAAADDRSQESSSEDSETFTRAYIQERGEGLFRLACKRDCEGVVAKWIKSNRESADREGRLSTFAIGRSIIWSSLYTCHQPYSHALELLIRDRDFTQRCRQSSPRGVIFKAVDVGPT